MADTRPLARRASTLTRIPMGKLSLLLVAAAVLAGTVLTYATRATAGATSRVQSEAQADQLAREIAESGRSLALTRMMGADGFVDPGIGSRAYDGGRYEVTVAPSADRQTAVVTVVGRFGGAAHTLRGTYRFQPLAYPGPIWLDVPFATSRLTGGTPAISGGPQNLPVRFDPRRHTALGLTTLLPVSGITADFQPDMTAAGSSFPAPDARLWPASLLAGLHVNDAEDLYQVAVGAMNATDRTLAGPMTLTSSLSAPGATTITRVRGPLTVASGGRLTGEGVLLVEGGLVVQPGGRLDWTGIVLVRSTEESLPVHLNGSARITGGLVVAQEAFPPGGHLDVTVWKSRTGLVSPAGDTNGPWAGPGVGPYPWYNHTHRWESEVPEGRVLYLAEAPADRHEALLNFRQALADAGSGEVQIEFKNEGYHGHAQYRVRVDSQPDAVSGTVRNGFPASFRDGGTHRSARFRADRLRDFTVDVRSLRALRQRFDGAGCSQWPFCVGQAWNRAEALRVRLLRAADGAVLYEAALYWHMREDERAAHDAAEAAWRASVTGGAGFGTHLQMGAGTAVTFALGPIRALGERLGFDDNSIALVNSSSAHATARDARAATP